MNKTLCDKCGKETIESSTIVDKRILNSKTFSSYNYIDLCMSCVKEFIKINKEFLNK